MNATTCPHDHLLFTKIALPDRTMPADGFRCKDCGAAIRFIAGKATVIDPRLTREEFELLTLRGWVQRPR